MTATERLRELLTERGVEWTAGFDANFSTEWDGFIAAQLLPDSETLVMSLTPQQAIAATLGFPKAKAHPYGYEPDTGAFDATRCECGCVNDISATYCNDCGGEIEIDMNAEKEIYHCPRHPVFAEKHDDGSLEFNGERYITATLGGEREVELQKALNKAAGNWARADAELRKALDFMQIWISEDAHLGESAISREFEKAEGLRKLDAIRDAITATLGAGTCHVTVQDNMAETDGMGDVWLECDACRWQMPLEQSTPRFNFCPNCGRRCVD